MVDWLDAPSDNELEDLDHFLRSHAGEEGLWLDGVHGLLTALAIGPAPATPDEWLPEVLHVPFRDAEQGTRVLDLLTRLNDAIGPELEAGTYEPILGSFEAPGAPPRFTARGWCEGFSRGVDLRAHAWEKRLGSDERLMQMLGPIIALAIDDGVLQADAEIPPLSDEDYETCLAQIPESVGAVAKYWKANHPSEAELVGEPGTAPRQRAGRWVH